MSNSIHVEEVGDIAEERTTNPTPASGGSSELPPVDLDKALAELDIDKATFLQVLDGFVETIPARVAEIEEAVKHADPDMLCAAAHTLKGSAGNVRAESIRRIAEDLETRGWENRLDALDGSLARLSHLLDQIRTHAEVLRSALDDTPHA